MQATQSTATTTTAAAVLPPTTTRPLKAIVCWRTGALGPPSSIAQRPSLLQAIPAKLRRHMSSSSSNSSRVLQKFHDQDRDQDNDSNCNNCIDNDEGQLVASRSSSSSSRGSLAVRKCTGRRFQWRRNKRPVDDYDERGALEQLDPIARSELESFANRVKESERLEANRSKENNDTGIIEHAKLISAGAVSVATIATTNVQRRAPILSRLMNYQMHDTNALRFNIRYSSDKCQENNQNPNTNKQHHSSNSDSNSSNNNNLTTSNSDQERSAKHNYYKPSGSSSSKSQSALSSWSLLSLLSPFSSPVSLPVLFVLACLAINLAVPTQAAVAASESRVVHTESAHKPETSSGNQFASILAQPGNVEHNSSSDNDDDNGDNNKRAVAELIAHRLLTTYYNTQLLGQQQQQHHKRPHQNHATLAFLKHPNPLPLHHHHHHPHPNLERPSTSTETMSSFEQKTTAAVAAARADSQQPVQQRQWPAEFSSTADHNNQMAAKHQTPAVHEQQQQQQQHSSAASWTVDSNLLPAANSNHYQHQDHASGVRVTNYLQQVSGQTDRQPQQEQQRAFNLYRPSLSTASTSSSGGSGQLAPTTPTLNRQLVAPPNYYELGLAQTGAIQLEPVVSSSPSSGAGGKQTVPAASELLSTAVSSVVDPVGSSREALEYYAGHLRATESAARARQANFRSHTQPVVAPAPALVSAASNSSNIATAAGAAAATRPRQATRGSRQYSGTGTDSSQSSDGGDSTATQTSDSKYDQNSSSNNNNNNNNNQQQQPVEKDIEPRQKRRMFNRILKKAEWNHLFVELSKVFLRYFLDLALKDMIGNKSGSSSSGSGDSSTTGRKKLDAQSELADLLKDFVKTAISNM